MKFRTQLQKFYSNQATLNQAQHTAGATSLSFALTPTVDQRLINRVTESNDFLKKIVVKPTSLQSGRVLGLGIGAPIASRTDTTQPSARRTPKKAHDMNMVYEYLCKQTNFDTFISYDELDSWAEFPDFEVRIMNAIVSQMSSDILMTGWNGTSAAANTDPAKNQLLQDVNVGWLEIARKSGAKHAVKGMTFGKGGDFNNLDGLVDAAINAHIHARYQNRTDIVVIASSDLVNRKYSDIWNGAGDNVNQIAAGALNRDAYHFANRPIETPSFMPAGTLLITPLSNLSIYAQKGTARRTIKDVPELNRVELYQSNNLAYAIEDYDAMVLVEDIKPKA